MKAMDNDLGQTAIEYLLLLLVVTIIAFTVFRRIDDYLVSNPNSFQNRYLRTFTTVLAGRANGEVRADYKRFAIPR